MRTRSASVCETSQPVADIEAGDQQGKPDGRHADPAARDGIDREKHATEKQRRAEILLKKEEQQRRRRRRREPAARIRLAAG